MATTGAEAKLGTAIKLRQRVKIVLAALMQGQLVQFNEPGLPPVGMADNYELGFRLQRQVDGKWVPEEDKLYSCGQITVGQLIRWCEALTEEQIVGLAGDVTLNQLKARGYGEW